MNDHGTWLGCLVTIALSCTGCASISGEGLILPIAADPNASVNAAGTYRWGFAEVVTEGTITFTQAEQTVTVEGVEYFLQPHLRDLTGQAELTGNVLDIEMVAKDGTEYRADVVLTFSRDGRRFTADFSDTNGDAGLKVGQRLASP